MACSALALFALVAVFSIMSRDCRFFKRLAELLLIKAIKHQNGLGKTSFFVASG
jgi:hypothetical protein